jgi:hypothetical protein
MNRKTRAVVNLEQQIHNTEMKLFGAVCVDDEEDFLDLAQTRLRVRVLSHGSGRPCFCYMAYRSAPSRGRRYSLRSPATGYSR